MGFPAPTRSATRRTPWTRRRFLGAGAGALAATWTPAAAWARRPPASERITLGLIGCGGMGNANLNGFLHKPEVQVLAVCDPDRDRREASRTTVEQFYAGRSDRGEWSGCADYNDYRDLLARADVDAVIIASPDHWHGLHVAHAAQAGKDVYGEKPLSLTVRQGRAMCDAVRRYARVFQTGSQQRSDARFRFACELVRNGRLGTVRRVTCRLPAGGTTGNHPPIPVPDGFDYDLWLGPAPYAPYCENRTHYHFREILDYSGGQLTDWGAHHIDIAQWALGAAEGGPAWVEGTGEFPTDGLWDAATHFDVRCGYDGGVELRIVSRGENGVLFEGDEGWLFVSRGRIEAEPARLLEERISLREERLPVSDDHRQNFLDCVRLRAQPVAPIEHAHRSISIAHLGNIAMQLGRRLRWDPVTESIPGDEAAERLLDRPPRAPWAL